MINAYIIPFLVSFNKNQLSDKARFYSFIASYAIEVVSFLFAVLGTYTMTKFGRRPLLLGCQVMMSACLIGTGILVFFYQEWGAMAVFTLFTAFLHICSVSIAWPYRAEMALEDVALFFHSCSHMTTSVLSAAI